MRNVRRALAAAALIGATVTAGPAMSAGADVSPVDVQDAPVPAPSGYWLVGADGGIFDYGEADFHGSMGDQLINEPVVGLAATPTGDGYWEVATDGGIFSFGDAEFHQSMGGMTLADPMIGIAATPTGGGYWTVAIDGGVFAFGDAPFYGSMGGQDLNAPVIGIVPTATSEGYWLVAEDGGVFNFGDAPFAGSLGGDPPDESIVGLAASGDGYVTVTTEGRIDAFGAPVVAGVVLGDDDAPIMAVANDANSAGFWLAAADGTVHEVGGAAWWDDARDVPLNAPIMAIASVARDSTGPTVDVESVEIDSTTVTFTADEPLAEASVEVADITTTSAAAITEVAFGGYVTITVTFDGPLALGDTVTLAAGSVTDLTGNAGPPEDVKVTVGDLTAPTVEAGTVTGDTATFVASEPLAPDSVAAADVTTSSDAPIMGVALGPDGVTIIVTFDVPLNDGDTVTLAAGSVTDLAGNPGPATAAVLTVPDRSGPTVDAGTLDGNTATFLASEPLDLDSVSSAAITTTSAAGIESVVLDDDQTTITATFAAPLGDGETVTLLANSVTDVAGNAGPASAVVLTMPDRTGPTVTAGPVDTNMVMFVAGEPLDPASVIAADVTTTSDAAITGVAVGSDEVTITVTVDGPLADGDTVTLLANSVTDLAGNAGPEADVVATVSIDAMRPFIADAFAIDNGDGVVSPNFGPNDDDVWTIAFSEPVTAASAEVARFVITDGTQTGVFICHPVGCILSGDGMTLTVNVLGLPVSEGAAPVPVSGIEYPVTITGFADGAVPEDLAGNSLDLAALDSDNVIEGFIP